MLQWYWWQSQSYVLFASMLFVSLRQYILHDFYTTPCSSTGGFQSLSVQIHFDYITIIHWISMWLTYNGTHFIVTFHVLHECELSCIRIFSENFIPLLQVNQNKVCIYMYTHFNSFIHQSRHCNSVMSHLCYTNKITSAPSNASGSCDNQNYYHKS